MPSLTPEEQERLLKPMNDDWKCTKCGKVPYRNYCRSCDEFFFICGCPVEAGSQDDHRNHRTY